MPFYEHYWRLVDYPCGCLTDYLCSCLNDYLTNHLTGYLTKYSDGSLRRRHTRCSNIWRCVFIQWGDLWFCAEEEKSMRGSASTQTRSRAPCTTRRLSAGNTLLIPFDPLAFDSEAHGDEHRAIAFTFYLNIPTER